MAKKRPRVQRIRLDVEFPIGLDEEASYEHLGITTAQLVTAIAAAMKLKPCPALTSAAAGALLEVGMNGHVHCAAQCCIDLLDELKVMADAQARPQPSMMQ